MIDDLERRIVELLTAAGYDPEDAELRAKIALMGPTTLPARYADERDEDGVNAVSILFDALQHYADVGMWHASGLGGPKNVLLYTTDGSELARQALNAYSRALVEELTEDDPELN